MNWPNSCTAALAGFLLSVTSSSLLSAGEVKIGISQQKDAFVNSLLDSKDLKAIGVSLVVAQFRNDREILESTIDGNIEVGLFALSTLDFAPLHDSPRLYTTFTRPFLFKSSEDIFAVQDTALGDAILAEIARAHVLPLRFWNRGLSQIVSRTPISSVKDFNGLKVSAVSEPSATPALVSLGAEPIDSAIDGRLSEVITRHSGIRATVWEPWTHYEGSSWRATLKHDFEDSRINLYFTDFQPVVGVLSLSEKYWSNLSERERQSWKRASHEAYRQSRDQILASEKIVSRSTKTKQVAPSENQRRQLVFTASQDSKIGQDLARVEEARYVRRPAEDVKKKN